MHAAVVELRAVRLRPHRRKCPRGERDPRAGRQIFPVGEPFYAREDLERQGPAVERGTAPSRVMSQASSSARLYRRTRAER